MSAHGYFPNTEFSISYMHNFKKLFKEKTNPCLLKKHSRLAGGQRLLRNFPGTVFAFPLKSLQTNSIIFIYFVCFGFG